MRQKLTSMLIITAMCSTFISGAHAVETRFSGYLSLVGGKVLSGDMPDSNLGNTLNLDCPCYIADWSNAGVYDSSLSLTPETHAGVQADISFSEKFKLTGQLLSRSAGNSQPKLEWFYASYDLSPQWTIQLGRKRIPLYFYSDFQDIGVAIPWVSTPAELYGWEVTNYNGASIRHTGTLFDADISFSFFSGSEKVKESRYQKLYYTQDFDVSWKNIVGGDFQLSKDWLTVRIVYLKAKPELFDTSMDRAPLENPVKQNMTAYGIAFNADFEELFFLTELGVNDRDYEAGYNVKAPAGSFGAGYRIGAWTPFINWGFYHEKTDDLESYSAPTQWDRTSFTLRYDWSSSLAIKTQIEKYSEKEISQLGGDSTVFRFSVDKVF